jgi:hypothetical protein
MSNKYDFFRGCFYGIKLGVNTAIILMVIWDFSGI